MLGGLGLEGADGKADRAGMAEAGRRGREKLRGPGGECSAEMAANKVVCACV